MASPADVFYPKSAAKPPRAVIDAGGWRQTPGGSWYKPAADCQLQFTDARQAQAQRPADAFYGEGRK